jgi:hypothetical protein
LSAQSWPVEVGWAFSCGKARALLIRPHETWPDAAWDSRAEALHGLTPARLKGEGAPIGAVCAELNEALAQARIYSDAPDWDAFWLQRLYAAAGAKPTFNVNDFGRWFQAAAGGRDEEIYARATRIAPHRHRAGADARRLQALYRLVCAARGR